MHNPLMCMKILVQSACAAGTPALDSSDLRVLDEELTRVQNLLQSFLNFARPAKLERRDVDLRNIVSQTTTVLAARAARRHISIEYRPPHRPLSCGPTTRSSDKLRSICCSTRSMRWPTKGRFGSRSCRGVDCRRTARRAHSRFAERFLRRR